MANSAHPISKRRLALTYVALVGLPVAILLLVVAAHQPIPAPTSWPTPAPIPLPTGADRQTAAEGMPNLVLLVAQLSLIVLATRTVGWLAERIRLPRVSGELEAFLALMLLVVRKPLAKIEGACLAHGELRDNLGLLLLVLMLSALVTGFLGLHLLFGAFLAGAIMPKNRQFVAYLIGRFESLTVLMLLPLFFAYTGLRTSIGKVGGMTGWWLCGLIVAVAVAGKLGGTSLTARLGGLSWRDSLTLGALMNTRGRSSRSHC